MTYIYVVVFERVSIRSFPPPPAHHLISGLHFSSQPNLSLLLFSFLAPRNIGFSLFTFLTQPNNQHAGPSATRTAPKRRFHWRTSASWCWMVGRKRPSPGKSRGHRHAHTTCCPRRYDMHIHTKTTKIMVLFLSHSPIPRFAHLI